MEKCNQQIKIVCGDMLKVLEKIPDESIDCCITDPPFGVSFSKAEYDDTEEYVFKNMQSWIDSIYRVMKEGGHLYLFVPTLKISKWIDAVEKKFTLKNLIATQYFVKISHGEDNNFTYDLQLIIFAHKGKGVPFNKVGMIPTSDVWRTDPRNKNPQQFTYMYPSFIYHNVLRANSKKNGRNRRLHSSEKSVDLIKYFIMLSTKRGETVLDPFAGSGSTAEAAIISGRKVFVIEKLKEKCVIIKERLKSVLNNCQVLNGG